MTMGHISFFYYTLSYSFGLPALVVVAAAYFRTGEKAFRSYFAFLMSVTLQLFCIAVLRYQDVTSLSLNGSVVTTTKRLYFLVESTFILTLPLFCHALTAAPHGKVRNLIFGSLFAVSAAIIASPFFIVHVPERRELAALPGFLVYRGLFGLTILYGIALLVRGVFTLPDRMKKVFAVFSLVSILFTLWEMLHCDLFPVLPKEHAPIPLSPVAYLVTNVTFLVYMVGNPGMTSVVQDDDDREFALDRYGISEREREIALLLVKGFRIREIGEKLFISESTVKTHIRNIYRKIGVSNRVGLVNALGKRS